MQITTKTFFIAGIFTFLIIGICQLINFFIFYNAGNFFNHLIAAAQIIFSFITSGFFYYLLKMSFPSNQNFQNSSVEEIKEAFEEEFVHGKREPRIYGKKKVN